MSSRSSRSGPPIAHGAAGLTLSTAGTALSAGSHTGEDRHAAQVRSILADAGLSEEDREAHPPHGADPGTCVMELAILAPPRNDGAPPPPPADITWVGHDQPWRTAWWQDRLSMPGKS